MKKNASKIKKTDIAIIGMSCRFPGSDNIASFWQNLIEGKELILRPNKNKLASFGVNEKLSSHPNYIGACGFLEDIDKFDHDFFKISAHEAAAMDPQQRIFLQEAYHTLENAGYSSEKYKGRIGVYAGSGPTQYYYELIKSDYFDKNPQSRQLLHYLGNEKDFLALRTAYALNLTGPAININLASATGLAVVIKACQSLANNEADIMLAGATSVVLPSQFGYIYEPENIFSADGHCRPFDKHSTGTVLGSGVALVALKRLADAIKDKDSIQAVIKGYAINNDGRNKIGFTAPSVNGQASCFKAALEMANIDPLDFKLIEAHGTGTHLGDPIEVAALTKTLNEQTKKKLSCAIGSVKSNIGHAQSAAGMAGLIKLILATKNKLIPPSLNFKSPNPKINFSKSPFHVNSELIEWKDKVRIGGVNSLAMGGVNAHVIVENYTSKTAAPKIKNKLNIIPLSANSHEALNRVKNNLLTYFKTLSKEQLNNKNLFHSVAYTLQVARNDLSVKAAYLCENMEDLIQNISHNTSNSLENNPHFTQMTKIKDEWLLGGEISWENLYDIIPKKISLPYYPFKKTRCWLLKKEGIKTKNHCKEKPIKINEAHDVKFIIDKITDIWKTSLGLDSVNCEDNFEKLGGDSLLAIDLISKIEMNFKVKISIEEFLKQRNIINLSNYIARSNNSVALKERLKLLTEKSKNTPSMFIIHPGNGELYSYQGMADLLNNKLNLIGIHNNIFNDITEEKPISIPLLAKRYINLIKKYQPSGPYILGGWSFGGVIAHEIAYQLTKENKKIKHLFLIDSWAKYSDKFHSADYFFSSYLKNNNGDTLPLSNAGLWGKLLWKRMEALFNYQPKLTNVKTTLLKANTINEEYIDVNAFDNHWQQYYDQTLSTVLIEGNHETILQSPGLEALINAIINNIDRPKSALEKEV